MESDLSYTDTITCHGVAVPRDMDRLSPRMIDVMESNRYERPEVQSLGHILRPDDRVMELGAGVGVVSTVAARTVGPENVLCVEADPGLQGLLRETHRLNGVDGYFGRRRRGRGGCIGTGGAILPKGKLLGVLHGAAQGRRA
jgi:hypothetical protein